MQEINANDIPARQKNLLRLAQSGALNARAYERALKMIGFTPDAGKWKRFLNVLLLVLGAGLTVCGIYFFFAYNWANMHRFVKLGIVEALIVGLVVSVAVVSLDKLSGKIALSVAGVLIGALLAVYGMIYQTGADSYTLFLSWTLLLTVWVFISRFTPLWFIWILLMNVSLSLYWDQMIGYGAESHLLFWLFTVNGFFVLAWEIFSAKTDWLSSRWTPRLLSLPAFYCVTSPAIEVASFGSPDSMSKILAILFVLVNAGALYVYSRKKLDLFMLTVSAACIMVVFDTWLAELLDDAYDFLPLILGAAVNAQAALTVTFLLRTSKSWEARKQ